MIMFAVFSARTIHTIFCDGYFYGSSDTLYHKDIRLSDPHGLLSHDSNLFLPERGKDNLSFYIYCDFSFMARTMKICNAGNNSICTATFAHETCAVSLSGDPYKDLAAFGFDLHRCQITYRKSPNKNGHTVTGRFNISGRTETGAGNSYPELILYVVSRQLFHLLYISLCHKQKRERNFASWLSRHPEYVAINQ